MEPSSQAERLLSAARWPPGLARLWRSKAALSNGVIAAGGLAAYVLLEWISFIHEHKGLPITPWNPGLGVVFALMVLRGPHYSLVLFVGAIIAEIAVLRSSLDWRLIIAISGIIAMGYGLVASAARRSLRLDVGLNRLRDILVLLLTGVAGAALVALLLSLLLLADRQLDFADVVVASWPLLVGDIIGIAVMTPLILRLAMGEGPLLGRVTATAARDAAIFVAVIVAMLWVIVGTAGPDGFKLFYLLFLPVVVAAVRYGIDGACIGLAFTQFALVGLLHRHGYDADTFTEFQMLMLMLSATGLVVGVVVTERQQAFRAIRAVEAQLRAKEAEAAQAARFNLVSGTAAALAHEIHQPMTAARALARSAQQILRHAEPDIARIETNLTTMITQIDHAASVVKRMREFVRRGQPHVSTIDIRALLEDALALARLEASEGSAGVALDVAGDLPPVHGDRVQLQQVVLNLVRNATEAIAGPGRPDGRIRVAARRIEAPVRIEIAVEDNGPGIAGDAAERLFEPMTSSKTSGFGLGLSICASIVEAHGGRIWLQSREAGATEFRFTLPLEQI